MRLLTVNLENFRNIERAQLRINGADTFLIGANAQGKTNLLEAAGFVTAARSFRTRDSSALIRNGQQSARLYLETEESDGGTHRILVELKRNEKTITVDDEPQKRLVDYIGRFPTVALSSDDIELVRGGPTVRRRWVDLTLASVSSTYFTALSSYHKALRERNRLLKTGGSTAALGAFEKPMAEAAWELQRIRIQEMDTLSGLAERAYAYFDVGDESLTIRHQPDVSFESSQGFLEQLETGRHTDTMMGITRRGPHRDGFLIQFAGQHAREYASEGQQRSAVLALGLAQAGYYQQRTQRCPVILADDVLGELDATRHAGFWRAVAPEAQVIATGTRHPVGEARKWQLWQVQTGTFTLSPNLDTK